MQLTKLQGKEVGSIQTAPGALFKFETLEELSHYFWKF